VTACTDPDCAGGVQGCPVTISASAFADGGDFAAGHLTSTGTANNVVFPLSTSLGNCEFTASNITTAYTVDYFFTDDRNGGVYSALLNGFVPSATNLTVTGTGAFFCSSIADSVKNAFANQAATAISTTLRPPLEAVTLDETVCPLQ